MPNHFARLIGHCCVLTMTAAAFSSEASALSSMQSANTPLATAPLPAVRETCGSRLDPQLLDAASQAVRIAPVTSQVWPGFHIPAPAILIYRPEGGAILISREAAPVPFTRIAGDRLPAILRGRTFVTCATLPGLNGNFDTDYHVGPITAVAVKLEPSTYLTLEVLFHESFHKFQDAAFARTIGASSTALAVEKRLDPDVVSRPGLVASMEVERRILSQAVKLGDARMVPLLRDYLGVRSQRRQALSTEVRDAELNIERKEGSAALVGSEVASRAIGRDPRIPSDQLKMFMSEPPESLPSGETGYGRFRARAFGSGAAIAWILTRLGKPWRAELQHGASFEAILAQAVGETAESPDAIKARFGYAQLLKDAEDWRTKHGKEASREDFYRTGPVRLIVEFPKTGDKLPEFKGEGAGLPSQPEDNIVILMQNQAFSMDYGPLSVRADKRPYMLDLTQAPRVYRVEITLDAFPRVNGGVIGSQTVDFSHGGTIEGAGVRLKIAAPATVRIAKDTMTVNVNAAE